MRSLVVVTIVVVAGCKSDPTSNDPAFELRVSPDPIELGVGESRDIGIDAVITEDGFAIDPLVGVTVTLQANGSLANFDSTSVVAAFMTIEVEARRIRLTEDNRMLDNTQVRVSCEGVGTDVVTIEATIIDNDEDIEYSESLTRAVQVTCVEGSPIICGAIACGPDDYCDDQLNSCGTNPAAEQICAPKMPSADCTVFGNAPVCGCNGQVYENANCAQEAGADISFAGGCTPPQGTFSCADQFCDPMATFCSIREAPFAICEVLPAACTSGGATPDCDCLPVKCPPGYVEASCDDAGGEITVNCTPT